MARVIWVVAFTVTPVVAYITLLYLLISIIDLLVSNQANIALFLRIVLIYLLKLPPILYDVFLSPIRRMYNDLLLIPWNTVAYIIAVLEITALYAAVRSMVFAWLARWFVTGLDWLGVLPEEEAVVVAPRTPRMPRRAVRAQKAREYTEMTGLSPPPFAVSPDTPPTPFAKGAAPIAPGQPAKVKPMTPRKARKSTGSVHSSVTARKSSATSSSDAEKLLRTPTTTLSRRSPKRRRKPFMEWITREKEI